MEFDCLLCRCAEADTDICGAKEDYELITVHQFCLYFASDLHPQGSEQEEERVYHFLDILHAAYQAMMTVCFVCGKIGATVACLGIGCDRRFHLPCAVEGGCVTRYFPPYSAFCWEHRPRQQKLEVPEDTNCLICMDSLEGRTTYGTMVCPVCKHAWFHRACIQGQAMRAGAFCFQCPLCQNRKVFQTEMLLMGIRIPVRQASWEDNNPYADLYERHGSCNARECLCPEGREGAEPDGPWELFLCCSCAAVGTHRQCSNLGNSEEDTWECESCAGLGTRKCRSTRLLLA
ncbi:G2/M phase-specific E3 ubiquitin-protein ligase-like [Melopsittacus undulatus]|uniref:G2/M phase-specific E3 ubiquitin-protein ligase-like n=1 Tax=Melopsittacus undulatus TaxID=13146 RepID=UPI00146C5A26|nr:G2/M phase-specific E3 ubiquitin-protein ligase-like [Melopsittacus undulatus]